MNISTTKFLFSKYFIVVGCRAKPKASAKGSLPFVHLLLPLSPAFLVSSIILGISGIFYHVLVRIFPVAILVLQNDKIEKYGNTLNSYSQSLAHTEMYVCWGKLTSRCFLNFNLLLYHPLSSLSLSTSLSASCSIALFSDFSLASSSSSTSFLLAVKKEVNFASFDRVSSSLNRKKVFRVSLSFP
jgi:hypothetical protein